ncbi:HlyD family secretion protein [Silvimonas sp. JCM 19000]
MSVSPKQKKRYIAAALGVLLLGAAAVLALACHASGGQSTDDAYVSADFTLVSPRVAGQISTLAVEDNQPVRKGQLLARIDDRDYVNAVTSAAANVAIARAATDHVLASLTQQQSVIEQARATLAAAQAASAFAQADFERYADLARQGAGSLQNAQQARSRIDSARADVARASASLQAARQQVAVLQAQRASAGATLLHDQALLESARLSLSWTRIEAPIDGMVGQRAVRVGAYVTPGAPLLALVPLRQVYVIANFQETQLTRVRPGQSAEIRVDAWPDQVLHGTVDSFAPATGVTFAAIAPDNATGNFTKVVQRIPVKIALQPGQALLGDLRAGMSVQATVDTANAAASSKVAAR